MHETCPFCKQSMPDRDTFPEFRPYVAAYVPREEKLNITPDLHSRMARLLTDYELPLPIIARTRVLTSDLGAEQEKKKQPPSRLLSGLLKRI